MTPQRRSNKTAVLDRIAHIEEAIAKANDYLTSGKHAHWKDFRALFTPKLREGKTLPPHKDWIMNVFLPRMAKALNRAERILERLD